MNRSALTLLALLGLTGLLAVQKPLPAAPTGGAQGSGKDCGCGCGGKGC